MLSGTKILASIDQFFFEQALFAKKKKIHVKGTAREVFLLVY
jgi:hypothetical protein